MKLTVVQSLAVVSAVGILPEVVEAVLLLKFLPVFVLLSLFFPCFAPSATIFLACYFSFLLLQLSFFSWISSLGIRTRDVHYSSLRSCAASGVKGKAIEYIFQILEYFYKF